MVIGRTNLRKIFSGNKMEDNSIGWQKILARASATTPAIAPATAPAKKAE
jgi:hypothetical protein